MEFFIKPHTVKSGWLIVYIKRSHFPKNIVFLSLKIEFVLANIADPNEMPHHHHLFAKVPALGFPVYKELVVSKFEP